MQGFEQWKMNTWSINRKIYPLKFENNKGSGDENKGIQCVGTQTKMYFLNTMLFCGF